MTVKQIYQQYKIPLNLQTHMLRVTAVAQILLKNWTGKKLDNQSIIQACLFHDMGNLLKFDLTKKHFLDKNDHPSYYWKKVKQKMIKKYSPNEHQATHQICQELNLSLQTLRLIKKLNWKDIDQLLKKNDLNSLIPIYCDMRIGPFGIMSVKQRVNNLKTRANVQNPDQLIQSCLVLEKILQQHTKTNLNQITDKQLEDKFNYFLELQIP